MFNKLFKWLLLIVLLLPVSVTVAVNSNEQDVLKRVIAELEAMRPLISEAQRVTDRQARLRFDFYCLISDYNLIISGIKEAAFHVRAGNVQPLCANYGQSGAFGEQAKYLQHLAHEFMSLQVLLNEAQQYADTRSRERVNYAALNADIDTVVYGIQQAMTSAAEQPVRLPVLRGGHTR